MHKLQISIPVYDFKCTVIIDNKIEKVIDRYMKQFKMERVKDEDEYHGLAIASPLKKYYIFYSLHSLTPNTIIHEICHMVDYMIEEKGIDKLGESRAYLTGYISEKVFDFVLKNKMLISKYLDYIQKDPAQPNAHVAE